MLTIRLQRTGKRNAADFRIVLAEKESPVKKKFNEVLGSYNPRKKDFRVNEERVKYWIGQHVGMSPTIHNLFVTKGLFEAKKLKAFSTPKKETPQSSTTGSSSAVAAETSAEAQEATAVVEEMVTGSSEETAADAAAATAVDEAKNE